MLVKMEERRGTADALAEQVILALAVRLVSLSHDICNATKTLSRLSVSLSILLRIVYCLNHGTFVEGEQLFKKTSCLKRK